MTQVLKETSRMTKREFRIIDRFLRRWTWARTGPIVLNLTVATFIVSCLLAKWTLAHAQEAQPATKAPEAKQKETKQKAKNPAPPQSTRAIPGAGKKVDALALAK